MAGRTAEKVRAMTTIRPTHLRCRMEAAHRLTQAHLDRIERQISARAERMTTIARAKARSRPGGGSRWTRSDEAMFRACVDRLSFERRGEIGALSRKLKRQEQAIGAMKAKTGEAGPQPRGRSTSRLSYQTERTSHVRT